MVTLDGMKRRSFLATISAIQFLLAVAALPQGVLVGPCPGDIS